MGFNNNGVEALVRQLKKRKTKLIIGGNIGKNTASLPEAYIDDYTTTFNSLHDVVDYFVVNVSCPNVGSMAKLQDKGFLIELLTELNNINATKTKVKPILLKIAPDLNDQQLDEIIEVVAETKIDGVIASNTSVNRSDLKTGEAELESIGNGGLSGQPVKDRSTRVIRYLSDHSGKAFPIIGVGGIHSANDAIEKIEAGASLVQVYTGFIYEGPQLVKSINKTISEQNILKRAVMMKLIECPRDAMQGLHDFIPTKVKANYINQLLKVGFDTIDFGSFVSPKAIPQLRDTAEVLSQLNLEKSSSKLLAIIANQRGAEDAVKFDEINYLGFPFSVSETFQKRNTNSSIDQSLIRVEEIQNLCVKHNKKMVVYLSMAFGNPYDDPWDIDIVAKWSEVLHEKLDVGILALSDTIGVSNPNNIDYLFKNLVKAIPEVEFGAHLHSTPDTAIEKVEAAVQAGCKRFDGAIKGFGGCPMAKDDLVGNMPTEVMLDYFNYQNIETSINSNEFDKAVSLAGSVFPI